MKKNTRILAVLLSVFMLLGMLQTAVFADDDEITSFTLTKDFIVADGYDNAGDAIENVKDLVTVDATFTIDFYKAFNRLVGTDDTSVPAFDPGTYTIEVSNGIDKITVDLPDYTAVQIGDYWYTITETAMEGTAGVGTDATNSRYLHVQVLWTDETRTAVKVASVNIHKTAPDDDGSYEYDNADNKTTGFTNTYGAGQLTVTKKVAGNMADPEKLFKVTVTFSAPEGKTVMSDIAYTGGYTDATGATALVGTIAQNWTEDQTVEVYLKNDTTVTFTNIPDEVTYTVVEDDYSDDGYATAYAVADNEDDDIADDSGVNGVISDSKDTVTITNTKKMPIDVGVILESAPFVLLMAGIAVFGILMLLKRRRSAEEELSF